MNLTPEQALALSDVTLPSSEWLLIDQALIDAFADVTGDRQFIHTDPQRTRRETQLAGTIAHGFLSLSLLSQLAENSMPHISGSSGVLNYGMERLRFLTPVPSGSRIRAHFTLLQVQQKSVEQLLVRYNVEVEIEHGDKPALVCEWMALVLLSGD